MEHDSLERTASHDIVVVTLGADDPKNPKNFSPLRKAAIVAIVCAGSVCVTCGSAIYTTTYDNFEKEFGSGRELSTVGLTSFIVAMGLGPLYLSPMSEYYGRSIIYQSSMLLFAIWQIPTGAAQNIQTVIISRFFAGCMGSAFLSVAGGTVADLYKPEQVSLPMAIYSASPFMGPSVGPLVGGFINSFISWRWTFWILLIWAMTTFVLLLMVPETYKPRIEVLRAKQLRKEHRKALKNNNLEACKQNIQYLAPLELNSKKLSTAMKQQLVRPFLLFAEPIVFLLNTYTAILLGILYLFFGAFPVVFEHSHGFNNWEVGLSFLGLLIGMPIGAALTIPISRLERRIYSRSATDMSQPPPPELKLLASMFGCFLIPLGLFWFSFTTYPSIHWVVPIVGEIPFAIGMVFLFSSVFTYLVEGYRPWAASALASNSLYRSTMAGIFPLFGVYMYDRLGDQWAGALLGFVMVAMMPVPFIFYKYGAQIRAKTRVSKLMRESAQ